MFACTVCSQTFRSEAQLRRHTNAEHRTTQVKRKRGGVHELTEEEAKHVRSQVASSMSEHVLIASIEERDRITDSFQVCTLSRVVVQQVNTVKSNSATIESMLCLILDLFKPKVS